MPQREDIASGTAQEEGEKVSALWAVLDEVQPGDVLVTQAYGDPYTGCFGEMLVTYCKGRGGLGLVVDGCIRDWPKVREIGLPVWTYRRHAQLCLPGGPVSLGLQCANRLWRRAGAAGGHYYRR